MFFLLPLVGAVVLSLGADPVAGAITQPANIPIYPERFVSFGRIDIPGAADLEDVVVYYDWATRSQRTDYIVSNLFQMKILRIPGDGSPATSHLLDTDQSCFHEEQLDPVSAQAGSLFIYPPGFIKANLTSFEGLATVHGTLSYHWVLVRSGRTIDYYSDALSGVPVRLAVREAETIDFFSVTPLPAGGPIPSGRPMLSGAVFTVPTGAMCGDVTRPMVGPSPPQSFTARVLEAHDSQGSEQEIFYAGEHVPAPGGRSVAVYRRDVAPQTGAKRTDLSVHVDVNATHAAWFSAAGCDLKPRVPEIDPALPPDALEGATYCGPRVIGRHLAYCWHPDPARVGATAGSTVTYMEDMYTREPVKIMSEDAGAGSVLTINFLRFDNRTVEQVKPLVRLPEGFGCPLGTPGYNASLKPTFPKPPSTFTASLELSTAFDPDGKPNPEGAVNLRLMADYTRGRQRIDSPSQGGGTLVRLQTRITNTGRVTELRITSDPAFCLEVDDVPDMFLPTTLGDHSLGSEATYLGYTSINDHLCHTWQVTPPPNSHLSPILTVHTSALGGLPVRVKGLLPLNATVDYASLYPVDSFGDDAFTAGANFHCRAVRCSGVKDCATCAAAKGCGWCGTGGGGVCVDGSSSGPSATGGNDDKADVDARIAFATGSVFRGGAGGRGARRGGSLASVSSTRSPHRGLPQWANHALGVLGDDTPPKCDSWMYEADKCPSKALCTAGSGGCTDCLGRYGCGWCERSDADDQPDDNGGGGGGQTPAPTPAVASSNLTCTQGSRTGPSDPSECKGSGSTWVYLHDQCPSVVRHTCESHSTNCTSCFTNPYCRWCESRTDTGAAGCLPVGSGEEGIPSECSADDWFPGACPVPCPMDCSGHGTCDAHTGRCTCTRAFRGAACDEAINANVNQLFKVATRTSAFCLLLFGVLGVSVYVFHKRRGTITGLPFGRGRSGSYQELGSDPGGNDNDNGGDGSSAIAGMHPPPEEMRTGIEIDVPAAAGSVGADTELP